MFSSSFDYYRAASVADVHKLWKKYPQAKLLAGGHSLIPLLKLRLANPSALIDIGRISALKGINASKTKVTIGALTTHAEIASSAAIKNAAPMLAEAAAGIGDPAVRNHGTIGGNVAHADPASDLPAVLLALDAKVVCTGATKKRTIAAGDFFEGMMTTALGEREMLTSIEFAPTGKGEGTAYAKFTHPASRYAVVGAAAWVSVKNGLCTGARVALTGLLPAAARLPRVEKALIGNKPDAQTLAKAVAQVSTSLGDDVLEDVFASAEYRRAMAAVFVKRALAKAFERAV